MKTPDNASRTAINRVKNKLPIPSECNCCGGKVRVAGHKEIYSKNYGDWPWVYLCESCGAYVGMHPFTNIPLGTLADQRTREARKKCKGPFEALWRGGLMTRSEAYEWLAIKLCMPVESCHFGWFDSEQCKKAKSACENFNVRKS